MKTLQFKQQTITPSKVVCIGRNYVEHIKELGNEIPENMVVFNKPNSAITDSLCFIDETTRFEAEICFLVEQNKLSGVGVGLDLTKATIQNKMKEKGLPWERAKAFDGSAVLSDFIALDTPLESLSMKLFVNDTLQQHATYELMMYKPLEMLEEIQSFMSLEDGDVIMSGTPKGVANYKRGDTFHIELYSDEEVILSQTWQSK
jgi:2-keto-4-pentenoate hydratase/2-oxohepta-3-ene-1,7-dioic acid hydratase in catechol pathway